MLLITGDITHYDKGDITLRHLIDMARAVPISTRKSNSGDAETGEWLGKATVDPSSLAVGGVVAATQTPETFMEEAARRIAAEAKQLRTRMAATKIIDPVRSLAIAV